MPEGYRLWFFEMGFSLRNSDMRASGESWANWKGSISAKFMINEFLEKRIYFLSELMHTKAITTPRPQGAVGASRANRSDSRSRSIERQNARSHYMLMSTVPSS